MNQENQTPISRRTLLGRAALGAGAAAAVVASGALPVRAQNPAPVAPVAPTPVPTVVPTATPVPMAASDLEIATFALGLERLEAAFYAQIQGAQQAHAYLSGRLLETATAIGAIEISHVQTLETVILANGGTVPPLATYRFPNNVFISPVAFSWFGYTLEEIGIGAYLGAVGQIKDNDLRKAAASIYGAETRHAAVLRSLGGFTFAPRYFETPLTVAQVQGFIAPYVS